MAVAGRAAATGGAGKAGAAHARGERANLAVLEGRGDEPSLIEFPSAIDVKAMGLAEPDFEDLVRDLVLPHVPDAAPDAISTRSSSGGKYVSVRVHFTATGLGQLEAIYGALRAEPRVLFTL